jgi:hypothetical protein
VQQVTQDCKLQTTRLEALYKSASEALNATNAKFQEYVSKAESGSCTMNQNNINTVNTASSYGRKSASPDAACLLCSREYFFVVYDACVTHAHILTRVLIVLLTIIIITVSLCMPFCVLAHVFAMQTCRPYMHKYIHAYIQNAVQKSGEARAMTVQAVRKAGKECQAIARDLAMQARETDWEHTFRIFSSFT